MYKSNKNAVIAAVKNATFTRLEQGAQEILNQSQVEVPVDDGELIGGARLDKQESGSNIEITVSYGNDPISAQYAVIQHENPFYNHAPGKKMKFLEDPFNQKAPEIIKQIEQSLKGL